MFIGITKCDACGKERRDNEKTNTKLYNVRITTVIGYTYRSYNKDVCNTCLPKIKKLVSAIPEFFKAVEKKKL